MVLCIGHRLNGIPNLGYIFPSKKQKFIHVLLKNLELLLLYCYIDRRSHYFTANCLYRYYVYVRATDIAGNSSDQAVVISVNDVIDSVPNIPNSLSI